MAAVEAQPTSITLSAEELLVVLNALETPTIPGLDAEAWRALSTEQQDLTLSVAQRSLEARGLAEMDDKGRLLVHRALLNAVGVCAYPHRTRLVEHWSAAVGPERMAGYVRDDDSVVHTATRGLHTFTLLPSEAALVELLVTACEWKANDATPSLELTVPRADFTRVCDASAAGQEDEALKMLNQGGASPAASALVRSLASGPRVSIVQRLVSGPSPSDQSFTLIDGGDRGWLVSSTNGSVDGPLKARTVSRAQVGTALMLGI